MTAFWLNVVALVLVLACWQRSYHTPARVARVRYLTYLHPLWFLVDAIESNCGEVIYWQCFSEGITPEVVASGSYSDLGDAAIDDGTRQGTTSVEWHWQAVDRCEYSAAKQDLFATNLWTFGYKIAAYDHRLFVHYWVIAAALALWPAAAAVARTKREIGSGRAAVRMRRGLCSGCGYDLRHSPDVCPECGLPSLRT